MEYMRNMALNNCKLHWFFTFWGVPNLIFIKRAHIGRSLTASGDKLIDSWSQSKYCKIRITGIPLLKKKNIILYIMKGNKLKSMMRVLECGMRKMNGPGHSNG